MFGTAQIFWRYGQTFVMRVTVANAGAFLDGHQVYAYVERSSDGAFFNFSVFLNDPGSSDVWALPGSFPVDLTELRGELTVFKIGALPLYYRREWTFPNNVEQAAVQVFHVVYWSPTLGHIAAEEVVFHPATMSFNIYQAEPFAQGTVRVTPS